jgi:hypothetical protein
LLRSQTQRAVQRRCQHRREIGADDDIPKPIERRAVLRSPPFAAERGVEREDEVARLTASFNGAPTRNACRTAQAPAASA